MKLFNFNRQFFDEKQKQLLYIANNKWLSWLLGLNRLPAPLKNKLKNKRIVKITPNQIFTGDLFNQFEVYHFTRNRFGESLAYNLSPFAYLQDLRLNKWEWRFSPVGSFSFLLMTLMPKLVGGIFFFATTDSYYAGAGDGYLEPHGATFTATHDATSGTHTDTSTALSLYVYRETSSSWWFRRVAIPINTSGIPDAATVTSATLYVYPSGNFVNNVNDAYSYVGLVHTFTASNTALEDADYIDIGSDNDTAGRANNTPIQQGGSILLTSLTGGAYRTIALDATGLGWISKTSYTKLGLRVGHDLVNIGTGYTTNGQFNGGNLYSSEQTGTDNDPYLSVTYIVSSISSSPSSSPSTSPSTSPSSSRSTSPSSKSSFSSSPSISISSSISSSISLSPSTSLSTSPSSSISPSTSPSLSPSTSISFSPSISLSSSPSESISSSISESPSTSISSSESTSVSISPSLSISLSPSSSISSSPSIISSISSSPSSSISLSPSSSLSASPSAGYEGYTRGEYVALPGDDTDLTTAYSAQDYIDVNTDNDVRVGQEATGNYAIHEYKDYAGSQNSMTITWNGQTNVSCTTSPVLIQIYNRNTTIWDTVITNNTASADTDFDMIIYVSDLTNYKDVNGVTSCRIYQLAQ
jgi:hypothetical protein